MGEVNQVEYVGDVLENLRKRKGFTQEEAAEWLGFTRHTYSDWERGIRLPSPKRLKHIANKYELNQADEDALYRASAQEKPKIRKLPFPRNPLFTGREAQLGQLKKSLQANGSVALTQRVTISGLGGIGKTQLALEYAYRHYPDIYRTVLWVNAADERVLRDSYVKLAVFLELPDLDEREPERSVQTVKEWLERHTNWLLIMDNADDLQLARSFFPDTHHGHILLTTRSQIFDDVVATPIEIDRMAQAEGLLFLLRRTHKLRGDTTPDAVAADIREAALQVVELLDGHPLALDQAGAYIQEAHVSFADYINLFDKTRLDLLETRWLLDDEHREHPEYSQHPEAVAVTFDLCFKQARARHPLAGDILDFCAFLSPDAIPEELFQHDDSFKYGTTVFNKAVAALRRYSLINRNDQAKTLSLHRLVQAVLIDAMPPDLREQWRQRVDHAVVAAFRYGVYADFLDGGFAEMGWSERLLWQVVHSAMWTEGDLAPTVERAGLAYMAGHNLLERGQYTEAEVPLALALLVYVKHLGADHPATVSALHDLVVSRAASCIAQGKYDQAEPCLRVALSLREKYLGSEHPETAVSLNHLAILYQKQGKYDQAELSYRRAHSIVEHNLGADHPFIASSLSGLAVLLHEQGKHEEAIAFYQRALLIKERHLGTSHPDFQSAKRDYADFLHSIGLDAEAAALDVNDEPSV